MQTDLAGWAEYLADKVDVKDLAYELATRPSVEVLDDMPDAVIDKDAWPPDSMEAYVKGLRAKVMTAIEPSANLEGVANELKALVAIARRAYDIKNKRILSDLEAEDLLRQIKQLSSTSPGVH